MIQGGDEVFKLSRLGCFSVEEVDVMLCGMRHAAQGSGHIQWTHTHTRHTPQEAESA